MLQIWTAQYRYPGPYRLDITVKGNDPLGKILAPTWDMLNNYRKGGPNAEAIYVAEYKKLIQHSKQVYKNEWKELLAKEYIVLTCFCPYPDFCHRHLAAGELIALGATFYGEIVDFSQWQPNKKVIDSFKGKYDWLSNFYPTKMFHNGIWYNSNEHFYVANKFDKNVACLIKDPKDNTKIIKVNCHEYAATCEKPKQFGKTAILPANWDSEIKEQVMALGIEIKFRDPKLKTKLIGTKGIELIEGNYWHDNFWGNCTCKKCITITGQNKLGKMLMAKRDTLI